jgi:hypothetical protein
MNLSLFVPFHVNEASLWDWAEHQDILTIEDIHYDGADIVIVPYDHNQLFYEIESVLEANLTIWFRNNIEPNIEDIAVLSIN